MDAQDLESYIRTRAGMLMVNYSKKENPTMIDAFVKHLKGVPLVALKGGFDRAEIAFERFPTIKKVMELCGECLPPQTWRYNFRPSFDDQGVPVLIDPDPSCDRCQKRFSEHPHDGCSQIVDQRQARCMYRPQDCAEGRAFLAKFREIAGKVKAGA